jgi:hypothetical protein
MADYIHQLAEETIRQKNGEKKELFEKALKLLSDPPPADAILAEKLELRADVQAHLASLTGFTPSKWLLAQELDKVDMRRAQVLKTPPPANLPADTYNRAAQLGLMGLCFSGGGIRSATFNLGVLQGLAELNLLRCFDYLSTVSGGGYIHQWFAAWSARFTFELVEKRLVPLPEPGNPGDHPEPIRWLRRYSNYLTPENGLFSGDTWVAIATWLRNTLLNQFILFSGLILLALLVRFLASDRIVPQNGRWVAACVGAIFYFLLQAIYLIGANLSSLNRDRADGNEASENGAYEPGAVTWWIVLPLALAAALLTLLLQFITGDLVGLKLAVTSLGAAFLFLTLAITLAFKGGAPLCYLTTHHVITCAKDFRGFLTSKWSLAHGKFLFVLIALILLCMLAAVGAAAWVVGSIVLLVRLCSPLHDSWWRAVLVLAPPLMLAGVLVAILLVVGLLGRMFDDRCREWLTRLSGSIGLVIVMWVVVFGFSLFGHGIVLRLWCKVSAGAPALAAWIAATAGGLIAGKSSKSSGTQNDETPRFNAVELAALVGPYAFIAGLLLLVAALAEVVFRKADAAGAWSLFIAYIVPFAVCWLFASRVDINEFSLHAFYRNRLARCYLGASNIPRHPNRFTGFDVNDAETPMSALLPDKPEPYHGPFPIFCTALNLTFGEDLAWQERKAASFIFTPLYSGYDVPWTEARRESQLRFNGFVKTETYAYPKPGIHMATATAISGAAVSPNMGYHTSAATAFLMTVFGVRLGWWLLNPRLLTEDGTKLGPEPRMMPQLRSKYPWPSPRFALAQLADELFGRANDTKKYVYLSDGGHFDNMGLYELVRRRCRYIVICDSEADGGLAFSGIGMAIRKCRIDFGAEIALDLSALEHAKDSQYSTAHCVVGTITYPEKPTTPGYVVYIKSSLTGDEPADVMNYKKEDSAFPHDSTLNQWFSESQFESYRRLGHHIAYSVLKPAGARLDACACKSAADRETYFENLREIWWAATPEMDRFSAAHTARFEQLMKKARTDKNIPGLFDMLFGEEERKSFKEAHNEVQIEAAVRFSFELIEFIFTVFNQLNLVLLEKQQHPYAEGWSRIFTKWAKIDVVQDGWNRYRGAYSTSFQHFAESPAVGLPSPSSAADAL